ncbi:MAG: Gfo/Idh/MocA family oxidoreductase [Candidatus Hinthialibacter antarcticus]|nr:Gfo/Idh/MocA family oxidoreductase [Candidatus Hinthialibacter antarcticus]
MKSTKRTQTSQQKISRRKAMIHGSAAISSVMVLPRYVLGGPDNVAPSDKLNVAVIGTGGRGTQNMKEIIRQKDCRVMAICDVTESNDYSRFYYGGTWGRGPAKEIVDLRYESDDSTKDYPKCKVYINHREMLENEKSIDACIVATPDHTHPITAMDSMNLGKHVYCEKPLARTVYECRMMAECAKKNKVATQLGNQGHSGEGLRSTKEWIQDGAIGEVREVHAWTKSRARVGRREGFPEAQPVPEGLDWDLWLGPAKKRPYNIDYTPYTWRGWWDFGTGSMGDFFCHNADPAFYALELGHPTTVEATQYGNTDFTFPLASMVYYNFPARGNMPPVKLTWYTEMMPSLPEELAPGEELVGGGQGILFVGSKGKIMCPGWAGDPVLLPHSLNENYKRPAKTIVRSKGHHRDWVDACKGGEPASASFEYGGFLTEMAMLGNAAIGSGEKLYWDGKNMKATNTDKAEPFLKPEYHNGWTI